MRPAHADNAIYRSFTKSLAVTTTILWLYGGATAADLKKFTLGYSTVGPAGTGLWMAKEIGAFEKHGIDAELIFISSAIRDAGQQDRVRSSNATAVLLRATHGATAS